MQRNLAAWTAGWLALIGFVAGCPFDVDDTGADAGVVLLTDDGKVIAYSTDGSLEAWSEDLGSGGYGDLLVDGGQVFAWAGGATIVALDGDDGTELWAEDLEETPRGRLAITGDMLFAQTADVVVALDADTGSEIWKQSYSGLASAMAVGNGALFCAGSPDVYKLDPDTGAELGTYQPSENINAIVVAGERVVLGGRDHVISVSAGSMTEAWRYELEISSATGMDGDGSDVYVSTDNDGVFGFSGSGDVPFAHGLPEQPLDPPVYSGGSIYVTESYGSLYSLDASTGDEEWSWDTSSGELSGGIRVRGDVVYLADGERLVGIPVDTEVPDWDQSHEGVILDIELL